MRLQDIYTDPSVLNLKPKIQAQGLDFQSVVSNAIGKVVGLGNDPITQEVLEKVVAAIEAQISKCILKKLQGKHGFWNIIRMLFS